MKGGKQRMQDLLVFQDQKGQWPRNPEQPHSKRLAGEVRAEARFCRGSKQRAASQGSRGRAAQREGSKNRAAERGE